MMKTYEHSAERFGLLCGPLLLAIYDSEGEATDAVADAIDNGWPDAHLVAVPSADREGVVL